MKTILLYPNPSRDGDLRLTREVARRLEHSGGGEWEVDAVVEKAHQFLGGSHHEP